MGIPDRRGCDGWRSSSWIGAGTSLEACLDWRGCDGLDGCCSSCLGLGGVFGGLEVSGIHQNGVLSSLKLLLRSSWSDLGLIWFMWRLIKPVDVQRINTIRPMVRSMTAFIHFSPLAYFLANTFWFGEYFLVRYAGFQFVFHKVDLRSYAQGDHVEVLQNFFLPSSGWNDTN